MKRRAFILLAAGLLYLIAANLIWIARDTRPPFWDMALHQTLALQIHDAAASGQAPSLAGFYPPLYHAVVASFYSLFGRTIDAAQWANLPAIALLLISTYALGRRVLDPVPAAAAAALVNFYPLMLWLSRETLIDYWLTSMVAFAMWTLLRTRDFSDRTRSIQFGLVCGLGMLTKWTFVFFLALPTLWIARKSPRNFAIATGVAVVVGGFWYLKAAPMLMQFLKINQAGAINEGDPARLGLQAVVFYIRALEGYQLFLPLFLAFLAGSILLTLKFDRTWTPIVLWLAGGWLGLLLFQNKDPRYSAPLLPAVALVTARIFQKREAWIFALAPILLFQHYLVSFGVPQLPATVVLAKGVEGPLSWNWNLYTQRYFDLWGPPAAEDWKIEHVLDAVSAPGVQMVRIGMVPDIPRFDAQAFQFYITLRKLPVTVNRLVTLDESAITANDYILASSKDGGFEAGSFFTDDLKSINHFIAARPESFPRDGDVSVAEWRYDPAVPSSKNMTLRSENRDLMWILALQLLLVLPFIAQPIHIDDPIFVDIGRNVLKHPWHAHDFPYIFEGRLIPDMASHSHPPFVGYWIGLLLLLFGDGPHVNVTLHLGFVIFPLLFAVGMYRLSRRFTAFPALVTTLAICSPAAIVASHTLMTDYPCLAFSVLGVALYVEGVDRSKPRHVWMSAVFLALAAFCSYPALTVALLCWLYGWQKRTKMRAAVIAPLFAVVWMAAWLAYSSLYFGRFVLGGTAKYVSGAGGLSVAGLLHKLLAFPIFLAAALALPIPLIRSAWREFRGAVAISWILLSGALVQLAASDYRLRDRVLLTMLLSVGGWIVIGLLLRIRHLRSGASSLESRQDLLFLTAWAVAVIGQILLLYSSQMGRYMLPLLPALILLAFFKASDAGPAFFRRSAVLASCMGLMLGLSLAAADFEMAQAHRDIARDLGEVFKGRESQVRFGAEWGLRHYMLEQGFRQFTSTGDNDISGGQFLVTPRQAVAYEFPQDILAMLIPVRRQAQQVHIPIRLINRDAHAGLYSSAWGLLPFAISRQPVEEITVQQVSYLNEWLPEIKLEAAPDGPPLLAVPAPGGGVDIVVPVPSRVRIPYDNSLPVRVQFSCIDAGGNAAKDCPIRVLLDRHGTQTEATLKTMKVDEIPIFVFEVPGMNGQSIVLDFDAAPAGSVKIRNWVMLPPEAWR